MTEVLIWALISGLLFVILLMTIVWGLRRKKRKFISTAIIILLILLGSVSRMGYLLVSKSYYRMSNAFRARTGFEIYAALFGKPDNPCVQVLHHQDQLVPKIDYAIWLHFKTCPDELKRVLQQHKYQAEKKSNQDLLLSGPTAEADWFKPESLGDSVWFFNYEKDKFGNVQYLYTSLDSTEVYCVDIAD